MAYACTQPNALVGREVEKTKAAQPLTAQTKPTNAQTPPQAATNAVAPPIGIASVTACEVECIKELETWTSVPPLPPESFPLNPGMNKCLLVTIVQDKAWASGMVGQPTAYPRVSFHNAPPGVYPTGTTYGVALYNATDPILRPNSKDLPQPVAGVSTFYTKCFVPNSGILYLTLEYYDPTSYLWPIAFRPYWGQIANPYVFQFKVKKC